MNQESGRIVVVGCGKHLASDESVGLEVVTQLRRTPGHICEVFDCQSISPIFVSDLPANAVLIFVDGMRTGSRPGTIRGINLQAGTKPSLPIRSEVEMLLNRASRIPQVYFIGIEIEKWDPGVGITSGVHAAALEVVRELAKLNGEGQPKLPFFT